MDLKKVQNLRLLAIEMGSIPQQDVTDLCDEVERLLRFRGFIFRLNLGLLRHIAGVMNEQGAFFDGRELEVIAVEVEKLRKEE